MQQRQQAGHQVGAGEHRVASSCDRSRSAQAESPPRSAPGDDPDLLAPRMRGGERLRLAGVVGDLVVGLGRQHEPLRDGRAPGDLVRPDDLVSTSSRLVRAGAAPARSGSARVRRPRRCRATRGRAPRRAAARGAPGRRSAPARTAARAGPSPRRRRATRARGRPPASSVERAHRVHLGSAASGSVAPGLDVLDRVGERIHLHQPHLVGVVVGAHCLGAVLRRPPGTAGRRHVRRRASFCPIPPIGPTVPSGLISPLPAIALPSGQRPGCEHVVDGEREHHARRRTADGAGQLDLDLEREVVRRA